MSISKDILCDYRLWTIALHYRQLIRFSSEGTRSQNRFDSATIINIIQYYWIYFLCRKILSSKLKQLLRIRDISGDTSVSKLEGTDMRESSIPSIIFSLYLFLYSREKCIAVKLSMKLIKWHQQNSQQPEKIYFTNIHDISTLPTIDIHTAFLTNKK